MSSFRNKRKSKRLSKRMLTPPSKTPIHEHHPPLIQTQVARTNETQRDSLKESKSDSWKPSFPELFSSQLSRKRKRPSSSSSSSPSSSFRNINPCVSIQPKNAVVTLNELKPGLEYKLIEHKGPVHMPTFVIQVTVNGETFTGIGRSKKQAKHDAAEAVLRSFVQFRDTCEAQMAIRKKKYINLDFTSDVSMDTQSGLLCSFSSELDEEIADAAATFQSPFTKTNNTTSESSSTTTTVTTTTTTTKGKEEDDDDTLIYNYFVILNNYV